MSSSGYPFVAVMADSFSQERRQLMRCLGAKVVLTPAALRGTGKFMKESTSVCSRVVGLPRLSSHSL